MSWATGKPVGTILGLSKGGSSGGGGGVGGSAIGAKFDGAGSAQAKAAASRLGSLYSPKIAGAESASLLSSRATSSASATQVPFKQSIRY